jgi:hypothetical protein
MTQTQAHDVSDGSGITTGTPDLRDSAYRNDPIQPLAVDDPGRNNQFQFTKEQIEKARQEERNKHQQALKREREQRAAYEQELADLRAFKDEQERQREEARLEAEKVSKREARKDLSAKEQLELERTERERELKQLQQNWEHKFNQMEAKHRLEQQLLQLQTYIQRRVAEEVALETIAPQFVDYIDGTNAEEVEASIDRAKEKTAQILDIVAQQTGGQTGRYQGVSVSTGPASMSSDLGGFQPSEDDIDWENISFPEFVKNRHRTPAGRAHGEGGMFA